MIISNATPKKRIRGLDTPELHCANCDNDSAHELYRIVDGRYLKFGEWVIVGKKSYVYICPICQNIGKEITWEQVKLLRASR